MKDMLYLRSSHNVMFNMVKDNINGFLEQFNPKIEYKSMES